jgi:hypothetical protein
MASPHLPKLSLSAYQMSCELRMELYFVLYGWFWQMKNNKLPSAEMVGLSSGSSELMLTPKFSILMIVLDLMMFSFCCFRAPTVSIKGWAIAQYVHADIIKEKNIFFMGLDLPDNNNA